MLNDPNPSGKWIAYDTNVWESLTMPYRHPGDNCNSLPPGGTGGARATASAATWTTTPPTPWPEPATRATRARTEPPRSTARARPAPRSPDRGGSASTTSSSTSTTTSTRWRSSFADLGLIVKRYGFFSPGAWPAAGALLEASAGQAYNITATIPGADHPEETVLVGAHYDFTDSGPAAAWDSAEGHTEIMRMAYIMADYYRKTDTRPSVTLKFVPWDSEESGTFGSHRLRRPTTSPRTRTDEVRGYFNVDPCAGAYPAFKDGTDGPQIPEVMQLANPANFEDAARDQGAHRVLEHQSRAPSSTRSSTTSTTGSPARQARCRSSSRTPRPRPAPTTSESLGGAPRDRSRSSPRSAASRCSAATTRTSRRSVSRSSTCSPTTSAPTPTHARDGGAKGLEILHTNNDNLLRINRLTSGLADPLAVLDPTGTFASEGWAKGQEFCAQVESWGMLQPEMAGAQTSNTDPVAYYEALPNEALVNQAVNFDATGTYQYSNVATRTMEPDSALSYAWDFGDGSHRYRQDHHATRTTRSAGTSRS